jgi:hypothetical protein
LEITPINKSDQELILKIYNEFFKKSNETCLDVFLCGKGWIKGKPKPLRDELNEKFKKDKYIRILYPEDLFIEIFNKDKHYNMLRLEEFLAVNSDVICIVCEDSPGAFVELGAFTNNSDTFSKVLALVHTQHKKDRSFIMLGPIKSIIDKDKDNVLFYTSDIDETYKELSKRLRLKLKKQERTSSKDINTIIGLYYFIIMLLYFYKNIEIHELVQYVKCVANNEKITFDDFNLLYNSVLRQLYKDKLIEKTKKNELGTYCLTEKGVDKFYTMFYNLKNSKKTKQGDYISLSVLANQYYRHRPA